MTTTAINTADTAVLDLCDGRYARCIMGELQGVEGEVVGTRTGGRVLLLVAKGVYLEVPRICVQQVKVVCE